MGPPTFSKVEVEVNPQGFEDKMEKLFWVMYSTNVEGVNVPPYYFIDLAY